MQLFHMTFGEFEVNGLPSTCVFKYPVPVNDKNIKFSQAFSKVS